MVHTTVIVITLLFPAVLGAVNNGTRTKCFTSDVGFQCSPDCTQLGYCDEHTHWIQLGPCPAGQICVGSACVVSSTCPTPPSTTSVVCADASLKMPNLEDKTCRTYYTCVKPTSSAIGYGVLQNCRTGLVFNACTGECEVGSCPSSADCQNYHQILQTNPKLAYVCSMHTTSIDSFLWTTCPKGIFVPLVTGPECIEGVNNNCTNGASIIDNTCTSAGRYPIANTDCGYLQCYSDLSSSVFPCRTGYRYDDIVKECVAGACTGTLPTPAVDAVMH